MGKVVIFISLALVFVTLSQTDFSTDPVRYLVDPCSIEPSIVTFVEAEEHMPLHPAMKDAMY